MKSYKTHSGYFLFSMVPNLLLEELKDTSDVSYTCSIIKMASDCTFDDVLIAKIWNLLIDRNIHPSIREASVHYLIKSQISIEEVMLNKLLKVLVQDQKDESKSFLVSAALGLIVIKCPQEAKSTVFYIYNHFDKKNIQKYVITFVQFAQNQKLILFV